MVVTVSSVDSNGASFVVTDSSTTYDTYYYFQDALGTARVITASDGTVCYDADLYPYGGERVYNSNCEPTQVFTSYERDGESGNDYASARYYTSLNGRFLSPDPVEGDPSDPQTLNRYAYVRNNPANLIDPTGLDSECDDCEPSTWWGYDPGWGEGDGGGDDGWHNPAVPYNPPPNANGGPFTDPLGNSASNDPTAGEVDGIPTSLWWNMMSLSVPGISGASGCTYGTGACGGGVYGFQSCASGGCPTFSTYGQYLDWLLGILGPNATLALRRDRNGQTEIEQLMHAWHPIEAVAADAVVTLGSITAAGGLAVAGTASFGLCAGGPLACVAGATGGAAAYGSAGVVLWGLIDFWRNGGVPLE